MFPDSFFLFLFSPLLSLLTALVLSDISLITIVSSAIADMTLLPY